MVSQMTVKETLHVSGIRWCMMAMNIYFEYQNKFYVALYGNIDEKTFSNWLETPEEDNKAEEYLFTVND